MDMIKEIVNGLIETYNTNDVYELCDFLNIEILRGKRKNCIKSYFFRDEYGDEFIFLNDSMEINEERELIAHELGHAILHTDINIAYYTRNDSVSKSKLERQANKFAAELLLSHVDWKEHIYAGQTIRELAYAVNVSEEVLSYKFNKK